MCKTSFDLFNLVHSYRSQSQKCKINPLSKIQNLESCNCTLLSHKVQYDQKDNVNLLF